LGTAIPVIALLFSFLAGMAPNPDPNAEPTDFLKVAAVSVALSAAFLYVGILARALCFHRRAKFLRLLAVVVFALPAYSIYHALPLALRSQLVAIPLGVVALLVWLAFSAFVWPAWLPAWLQHGR
jgi:hypothetical protein